MFLKFWSSCTPNSRHIKKIYSSRTDKFHLEWGECFATRDKGTFWKRRNTSWMRRVLRNPWQMKKHIFTEESASQPVAKEHMRRVLRNPWQRHNSKINFANGTSATILKHFSLAQSLACKTAQQHIDGLLPPKQVLFLQTWNRQVVRRHKTEIVHRVSATQCQSMQVLRSASAEHSR